MKLKYLFLLLTMTLCFSCSDDDVTPALTIDETELTAEIEGSQFEITVTSTSAWTVSAAPAWVEWQVNESQTLLTLTVDENLNQDKRTGTITLTNEEDINQSILIEQEAYTYSANHHYKLPVVFHVLYWNANNTQHYVEAGHLQKVMDRVNQYYRECGVDLNLEFVMATEDPEGNRLEEPGVSREKWQYTTMDCSSFMGSGDAKYKSLLWDTSKYVNIMLYNFSDSQILGISQFPWLPEPYELEGISIAKKGANLADNPYPQCVCINNKYIYDLTNDDEAYSVSDIGVTLAHELGHFLGLYHAFNQLNNGNTNTSQDTDYCTDTPPYNKYQYDIRLTNYLTFNPAITSKSSEAYQTYVMRTNSQTGEEFRSTNIMDYAISDANSFSEQQKERVRYILQHALFMPGPKDYTGTDFTATKGASDFQFTPNYIE